MSTTIITSDHLDAFKRQLHTDEKSWHTIRKYVRDARVFWHFAGGSPLTKDLMVDYKQSLIESGKYTDGSINSILASLRRFFRFLGRGDCCVASIRTQETPYCPENRWLAVDDYKKLLNAAKTGSRLEMILRVLGETGIRISELKYFTVEAIKKKSRHATIRVSCKKKSREILVSDELREELFDYIEAQGITEGVIFRTRSGKPVDRSNLWKQIKRLCKKADVDEEKVYPHNLRKLFARTFYELSHDLAQLACLLGHSSVNTTMLYIKRTEDEVRMKVNWMRKKVRSGSPVLEKQNSQGQILQKQGSEDADPGKPDLRKLDSEKLDSEKQDPKKSNFEKADPEKMNPEKMNPEKMNPEKMNPEKMDPEKMNPEKMNLEKMNPEKMNPEKPNPEKPNPEKPNPEKTDPQKTDSEKKNPRDPKFGGLDLKDMKQEEQGYKNTKSGSTQPEKDTKPEDQEFQDAGSGSMEPRKEKKSRRQGSRA